MRPGLRLSGSHGIDTTVLDLLGLNAEYQTITGAHR